MTRPRIGANMLRAVRYVEKHPGCAKVDVAQWLRGSAGNVSGGYMTVKRAIAHDLIHATVRDARGVRVYSLTIAPAGAQLLKDQTS